MAQAHEGAPLPDRLAGNDPSGTAVRHHEIERGLEQVCRRGGGVLWIAEPGMGKSTLLATLADAIRRDEPAGQQPPGIIRIGAHTLGGTRALRDVQDTLIDQIERATGLCLAPPAQPGTPRAASEMSTYVRDASRIAPLVLCLDDYDRFDDPARELLPSLVAFHDAEVVVLATATTRPCADLLPHDVEVRTLPGLDVTDALAILEPVVPGPVSPAVADALVTHSGGNPGCIRQTARLLTAQQLAGTSMLPDPLPATSALESVVRPAVADLTPAQRDALLVAAVAVVDRVEVLAAATSLACDALTSGPLSGHLTSAAGRFRFADPRVRALVHADATVAERTGAHAALARVHRELGEDDLATWHAALATLEGDPALVPGLLDLAARHRRRGDTVWAHTVAREAAGHAQGELRRQAYEDAGVAAVLTGHVYDAQDWLRMAADGAAPAARARTLWAFILALTLAERRVPDDLLERAKTEAEGADATTPQGAQLRRDTARAMSTAACLHLERGNATAAWRWSDEATALTSGSSDPRDFTSLARSWLAIYSRATPATSLPTGRSIADEEGLSAMARAVWLMEEDECDAAARLLASAVADLAPVHRGGVWFASQERSVTPLVEAHLRVVQALVELRAGDLNRAHATITKAMLHGPAGLVLGGLGGAIARRIDVLRTGSATGLTAALVATSGFSCPTPNRLELLVDRAIGAALRQDWAEAATLLELAALREAREKTVGLATPGLNAAEIWVKAGRLEQARKALDRLRASRSLLSPATRAAVLARAELAVAAPAYLDAALEHLHATATALASPYERGRSELSAAWALGAAGRDDEAWAHYMAAQDLLDEAGSMAWMPSIERDSARIAPHSHPQPADDGGAHREPSGAPWGAELTDRERDVARLVVDGLSNRETAKALHLSVRTVEVHLGRVFRKLGVRSRVELTVLAHRSDPYPTRT